MKLTESLHEVYEPDWYGREDVKMVGEVRAGWQLTGVLEWLPEGFHCSSHLPSPLQGSNHKARLDTQKAAWSSTALVISHL